jgi:hypothetical protein
MINWWSGDGNASDIQGSNNGTLQNGAIATGTGMVGQAFRLDGINDYVAVANHSSLNGFNSATIDAWIKLNTTSGRQAIVSKVPAGEYYLLINNGKLSFENSNTGSGTFTGTTTLLAAVWYHVAVTYDGASTRLYVNGVEDGAQAGAWPAANSQSLSIGQRGDNTDFFNGFIDEVEIFNRALSAAEIQSLYNAGSFGKCKPTLAIATTGQCSAVVNYTAPSFSDNCSTAGINCSPASGTVFQKGATTINCVVSDTSGNNFANAFVVKVSDGESPVISCPSPVVVNTDNGQCTAVVNYTQPNATDNCSTVNVVCSPEPGHAFPKGVTDVTCTATDGTSNTASCTFTVTVNDREVPVLSGYTDLSANAPSTGCSTAVQYPVISATDNCSGVGTPVCTPPTGSTFQKGTTTVTCTSTDVSNNTAQCTFTVTVNDVTPPAITCPDNVTQQAATDQCQASVTYASPSVTDNCSGVGNVICMPASGSTFLKGITTVTCNVSDASGNSKSCSFTVNVIDTQPPNITCPSPISIPTTVDQCQAVATYANPIATDNCSGVGSVICTPASGSTFPKGTSTVTCNVSDASGNSNSCSFTVTVNDTQSPSLSCPSPISKSTDPNQCSAVVTFSPSAADNCSGIGTPVCTPASGSVFPKGTTTVNCTVTDAAGNQKSCNFTVTVNDTQLPQITCPQNITSTTATGQCSKAVTFNAPSVSDNCPGVGSPVCSPASNSVFPKGTTTVNCTVTDAAGNRQSCSFTVTVNDTEPPAITCPASLIKSTDPGQCSAVVNFSPKASDNCAVAGVLCSPASGSAFPKGVTTVTCTASDTSSNTRSCSFSVTVNDTQSPSIVCPSNITALTAATGNNCVVVNYPAATAEDNCGSVNVACTPSSGSCFPVGTTTVTCTATDSSGNKTSCGFTVTTFDVCTEDDSGGGTLLFNSFSGDYVFCCGGISYTGKGTVSKRGCTITLTHMPTGRRVNATVDTCQKKGTATLQSPPGTMRGSITDRDTSNNRCNCAATGTGGQ